MLTPDEEDLIQAVMDRDDVLLEYSNPFDTRSAFIELDEAEGCTGVKQNLAAAAAAAGATGGPDYSNDLAAAAGAGAVGTTGEAGFGGGDRRHRVLASCTGSVVSVGAHRRVTLAEIDAKLEALQVQHGRLSTCGSMKDVQPYNMLGSKQAGKC